MLPVFNRSETALLCVQSPTWSEVVRMVFCFTATQLVKSDSFQTAWQAGRVGPIDAEVFNLNFCRLVAAAVAVPLDQRPDYGGVEYVMRLPLNDLPVFQGLRLASSTEVRGEGTAQLLKSLREFLILPQLRPGETEEDALWRAWLKGTDALDSLPHGPTLNKVLSGVCVCRQ